MTIRRLFLLALAAAATAAPAAAEERWYAYEAENAAARYRTGDITVEVSRGFFGGTRVTQVFRRRGSDLPLRRADGELRAETLREAFGEVSLYAVDAEAGRGFAQGACQGAERAWIALPAPERFRPVRLHVLMRGGDGAPVLCETLEYRWRAEWDVPNRRRLPREDPQPSRDPF